MKKILTIIFLGLLWGNVGSASEFEWIKNQTQHRMSNGLANDDKFKNLLEKEIPKKNIYLGMSKKTKDPLIDSFLKVLGGPPNEIIYLDDKNNITISACRSQSCDEKGFVFINTEKKFIIGLIRHFFIDDEETKSFDQGDFLIFSKTHKSFNEIPKVFIQSVENWIINGSSSNTPPNKVRFIGSDNKINEVENVFNN